MLVMAQRGSRSMWFGGGRGIAMAALLVCVTLGSAASPAPGEDAETGPSPTPSPTPAPLAPVTSANPLVVHTLYTWYDEASFKKAAVQPLEQFSSDDPDYYRRYFSRLRADGVDVIAGVLTGLPGERAKDGKPLPTVYQADNLVRILPAIGAAGMKTFIYYDTAIRSYWKNGLATTQLDMTNPALRRQILDDFAWIADEVVKKHMDGYLFLQDPTTDAAIAAIERARARFVAVEASSWPLLDAFGPERFMALSFDAGADTILANGREAEVLTGRSGADAARALGERFRVVCVKVGVEGAAMAFEGALVRAPGEPIVEADPTGAGDAFDGVFLSALARGAEPEMALQRACHAGALVAASSQTWPEVVD